MINLNDYPLTYIHRTTKKKIRVKCIIEGEMKYVDPDVMKEELITRYKLGREYRSAKENRKVNARPGSRIRFKPKGASTKAFREYLKSAS